MSPILVACFLLCCGYIGNTEAGKGKVPIYMPIPIPVPMPMGPSEGPRHPQQHMQQQHYQNRHPLQHQQHHQEDEGEVKKIYLLQPIARSNPPANKQPSYHQPQAHMVPNHPPVIATPRFQMQSPQYDVGGGIHSVTGQEEYHQTAGTKHHTAHNIHSNDLKILPIVVIPPIAPMQPIQLQPDTHESPQRVSVGSQINNYVSTIEPPLLEKPHRSSQEQFHDMKTFSEYGGSGGGAVFREQLAPRRFRQRMPRVPMQVYRRAGSRLRPRYSEVFPDDYDYGPPPPMMIRHQRVFNHMQPRRPMMTPLRMQPRRRQILHPEQLNLRIAPRTGGVHDSIRDIIDQQVHFDDGEENRNQARLMDNLTADNTDPKDSIAFLDDSLSSDSVSGPKKQLAKQTSRFDQHHQQDISNHISLSKYSPPEYNGGLTTKQASDLTYYEHDIPQSSLEFDNHKEAALIQSAGNKIYSDEREALEDDEWWFDTVKSVSHASPASSNHTTSLSSNTNSTSTSTSTSTVAPIIP